MLCLTVGTKLIVSELLPANAGWSIMHHYNTCVWVKVNQYQYFNYIKGRYTYT